MRIILAYVLMTLIPATSAGRGNSINYCGSKMCDYTNSHTFCKYSADEFPSQSCIGLIPAPLKPEEKSRILARMNRRRNDVAKGKLRGFPPAGNMMRLRWIKQLAEEAQLWADECRPPNNPEDHDECRDLYSMTVGQCIASIVGETQGLRVESMIDIWYMQNLYYKGNITLYSPSDNEPHYYGDFAQLMWAESFMVGCGRSRFLVESKGRHKTVERLVCNFAPKGAIYDRPVWSIGEPASACPLVTNPYDVEPLTGLCDYPDKTISLQNTLDKKERAAAVTTTTTTVAKIHRDIYDLDDIPPDLLDLGPDDNVNISESDMNFLKTFKIQDDRNKTEKTPVLNMMLRYIPFLKDYESQLLGTQSSNAVYNTRCSSLLYSISFINLCFFSFILF